MFKVNQSIKARCFRWRAPGERPMRLIVIHTTQNKEAAGVAKAVAYFFTTRADGSSHYVVDDLEVYQCVDDWHEACGAPGANHDGIHVEHAGMAGQTPEEWMDLYSQAELRNSADLVRALCEIYEIPPVRLTVEQVRDGVSKGICGHVDVSRAFGKSDHTDPGEHFPWDDYIRMVTGEP